MKSLILISFLAAISNAYDLATAESDGNKAQHCLTNKQECEVACAYKTSVNTCDPTTLAWQCLCDNGKLPSSKPSASFRIESQQCDGELLECVDQCLVQKLRPDRNACTGKCKDEKKCGTVSSTQTKSYRVIPDTDKTEPGVNNAGVLTVGASSVIAIFAMMI
jgi:hypothetical protein